MQAKSSHPQQYAVAKVWTADFSVLGQALYHWAILPVYVQSFFNKLQRINYHFKQTLYYAYYRFTHNVPEINFQQLLTLSLHINIIQKLTTTFKILEPSFISVIGHWCAWRSLTVIPVHIQNWMFTCRDLTACRLLLVEVWQVWCYVGINRATSRYFHIFYDRLNNFWVCWITQGGQKESPTDSLCFPFVVFQVKYTGRLKSKKLNFCHCWCDILFYNAEQETRFWSSLYGS